jgi:hypothetical protein
LKFRRDSMLSGSPADVSVVWAYPVALFSRERNRSSEKKSR